MTAKETHGKKMPGILCSEAFERQPYDPESLLGSVIIEAVPAQVGALEPFVAHGLHGIPEDRLHRSDFYEHPGSESTQ